jgi:beta-phosphoglucomutase-like phosphatase (HAD superfamily)
MSIEALVFDCDGTLADSMPLHWEASQAVFTRHGLTLDERQFYAWSGVPTREIVRRLAAAQQIDVDLDRVVAEKEAWFGGNIHRVQPVEWVVEEVRRYRGKLPMAVASGGLLAMVELQIEHVGLAGAFEVLVTAEDTQRPKPDPQVFLEAARRMNVAPERCRVYEDADLGIEAARRAGMQWIDIRPYLRRTA